MVDPCPAFAGHVISLVLGGDPLPPNPPTSKNGTDILSLDPRALWPDFRDAWVIGGDADLVVVDKPAGVASQAADPDRPDDLVTRLRSHLSQSPNGAYLGVHQRLDRDTSGVLVFARRKEANAGLAAQFEGRRVKKTYVAAVEGWPRSRDRGATLRDVLVQDKGGLVRVAPRGARGGKPAVTHVKVRARRGERALLELDLETGRTHQARVQLAHAGTPIAGDAMYGGPPAPRLLLHAAAIALAHPTTGQPVRFEAPAPAEFAAWLERGAPGESVYDDPAALARALDLARERRWGLGRSEPPRATTAFRLVNEEGDALPRLAVDVYGGWLVAQLYGDDGADGNWADPARRDRVLDALHRLGFDGVYLKVRPRQANMLVDTRRDDLAPALPVRGVAAPDPLEVFEEGMPLLVRLGDGLSTGVFLDQRNNRRRVRDLAADLSVANLFAYTCAFTVAAATGGASRTVSVDASAAALERGRANLAHAGLLDGREHTFVAEDAFAWLSRAARRGERFDLVLLDPPSYSTTRRGRFVADRDYGDLAAKALAVVAPGGLLVACTNHRGITSMKFRRILFEAARTAGRDVTQLKDIPEPPDFPVAAGGVGHMKTAFVRLGPAV
jgi:23S rRNA (cytosine1962-C5)-methyltransferase